MTRNEIFWMLLITIVLGLGGMRAWRDNPPLAILMIAIPLCAWAAMLWGKVT